jgi:hypothetical protein
MSQLKMAIAGYIFTIMNMPLLNADTSFQCNSQSKPLFFYSLFFILGHLLGGRVKVTDGIFAGYIYNYEHVITQYLLSTMENLT